MSPPHLSLYLIFSLFYISLPFTLFIFSFLMLSCLSSTVFTLLSLTLSTTSSFHFHPYLILPYSIHCHPCLSQTFHFPNSFFFLFFYQCIFHNYYLTVQFLILLICRNSTFCFVRIFRLNFLCHLLILT